MKEPLMSVYGGDVQRLRDSVPSLPVCELIFLSSSLGH